MKATRRPTGKPPKLNADLSRLRNLHPIEDGLDGQFNAVQETEDEELVPESDSNGGEEPGHVSIS